MKRILYFAPGDADSKLANHLRPRRATNPLQFEFTRRRTPFEWMSTGYAEAAFAVLDHDYVNLLIVDLRDVGGALLHAERVVAGMDLLAALDRPGDLEARYGFHRIIVLVSGKNPERIDRLIKRLGSTGVGRVIRDRSGDTHEFAEQIRKEAVKLVLDREVGKTALAASGGGITGIFFELGALKCLDDALKGGVNNFDMYFGISAGAVVTSVLASGFSVDEFMAAVAGVEGGRVPFLDLRLMRWGHLNVRDMQRRAFSATKGAFRYATRWARKEEKPSLGDMVLEYSALVGPPFKSDNFEVMLREILEQPGASNDFRDLDKRLFVGASDQDTHKHVLFGADGWDDVPISKAVQASLSIHPAFGSVEIDGRYYEDGAITRTSDFVEAIQRDADLLFVLDPFVPYVSKRPGDSHRRGVLYNIDQEIRSLSYTRFENTRNWVLRKHPQVSSYTFLPSNRLRHILSRNPMDHRPYMEIWRGAYISTADRLETLCHRMRGDLHAHGIEVDMPRMRAVSERLKRTPYPTLADFFPDGKLAIRRPPLRYH